MQKPIPIEDILTQVQQCSLEEELHLVRALIDDISKRIADQQKPGEQENAEPLCDVREFRGIGHETWADVGGVDEFIKQERASWDERNEHVKKETEHEHTGNIR